ncbi:MFS transporter [Frankia sp. QA3]|uniref:MFS transporter n=1 Tax=Frankia sp. QA3 TaxID=710111 RepID=UPI000269C2C9|nr:MFS transporter [Frankia sp. QA3]EIV91094.1 sugar phosphate permease [Frankia sp. QA3]
MNGIREIPPAGRSGPAAADRRRWVVLAAGLLAMTAGCAFQYGLPYLIPALRAEGLSLRAAGLLAACPTAGLLVSLVAWGAAADRFGERLVLASGLGLAGLVLGAASAVRNPLALGACLVLAGAAGASVHASSGRLILGWFAAHERGLAMGARQTAQPLGVAVAAIALPPLADTGRGVALAFLAGLCVLAAAVAAAVTRDPARPPRPPDTPVASPYRTPLLWRIHAASALLVVPQFAVATFAVVFLVDAHGWSAQGAGRLLAIAQLGGAAARLGAGVWSDRVGSRLLPMRILATATAAILAVLALAAATRAAVATGSLLLAAVLAVSTNGLAFTAVAENAGPHWAGRALGIHNTGQNAVAAATPPVLAALIDGHGYPTAFAATIVFPLLAAAAVPARRRAGTATPARRAIRRQPPRAGAPHPDG